MGSVNQATAQAQGLRLIALISFVLGVTVTVTSGYIIYNVIWDMQDPDFKQAITLLGNFNLIGVSDEEGLRYDLEYYFKVIIISCSITLVGGRMQLVISCGLHRAASNSIDGSSLAGKVWMWSNLIVLCTLGGGFIGILTSDPPLTSRLKFFLGVTGIDFILLIYFLWIVYVHGRNKRAFHGVTEMDLQLQPLYRNKTC
ncbi:unnamed protein product [Orchesella dallaii]|uniref:Uncharacterized protein n=1 Tax=Orchesella dallaii TaxID=48710 RepID=A0ABP1S238_9HEXA